jgi:hypothetical protein
VWVEINEGAIGFGSSRIDGAEGFGGFDVGRGVSYQSSPGEPFRWAQADAYAGQGVLRSHAFAQWNNNRQGEGGGYTAYMQSTALSRMEFNDLIIQGPAGGQVATSINLNLSGSFITGSTFIPDQTTLGQATVQVSVLRNGSSVGAGDVIVNRYDGSAGVSRTASGILADWGASGGVTTASFMAPVGTPFSINVSLQAGARVMGPAFESFLLAGNSDFGSTLTFALDGPGLQPARRLHCLQRRCRD